MTSMIELSEEVFLVLQKKKKKKNLEQQWLYVIRQSANAAY